MTDTSRWNRVKQLFEAALEQPPNQREVFLHQTCGEDSALLADVESLLAADEQAGSFAERPVFAQLTRSAAVVVTRTLHGEGITLKIGDCLGPYEINEFLEAGGMGEVYRALDTNLGRPVAIKVLPRAFTSDPERLARFEREARVLASLSHPNIETIHALEERDGARALVLELIDGPTLAQRLKSGPFLVFEEALTIARQVAEALEAAHEKGIIHRDLKPGNIKIASDQVVKVLDFGLAKVVTAQDRNISSTAGGRARQTQDGLIVGTASYMSPEQARGEQVDKRTDIWAFGCILFEMLTGRAAFPGPTIPDILVAILEREPDWQALPKTIPARIRDMLQHCLAKDPKHRLRDIGDATLEIDAAITRVHRSPPLFVPVQNDATASWTQHPAWLAWIGAIVLLSGGLIVAGRLAWYSARARASVNAVFTVQPPDGATFAPEDATFAGTSVAVVSPDGRHVAFVAARVAGPRLLWIRALDSLTAQPLPGTDGATSPFWSPDGQSIGFFAGGKLRRIDISGGPAQVLADAPQTSKGAWSTAGIIVYSSVGPLYQVPASGGTPRAVTKIDPSRLEYAHAQPHFLPDGRHFLYFARAGSDETRGVYAGRLDSSERKRVLAVGSKAEYSAPGYLLFVRDGTLMAQPFDVGRLQVYGDPIPIAANVRAEATNGGALFSVSRTGVLTYRSGVALPTNELVWVDRSGRRLAVLGPPAGYLMPFLSPDEKRVSVEIADPVSGKHAIWVLDTMNGVTTRFKLAEDGSHYPVWSPDGSRILYFSDRDGRGDLYQKTASGNGREELVLKSHETKNPIDWSLDGRFVLYSTNGTSGQRDLWMLPLDTRQPLPYLTTNADEAHGRFSPDGKWIAYASNESGQTEVYVQSFPPSGARRQVSIEGGAYPAWRRDQKELFYVGADGYLMAAKVVQGSTFETDRPAKLFQMPDQILARGSFAIAGDGQRILITAPVAQVTSSPFTVVLDWQTALRK